MEFCTTTNDLGIDVDPDRLLEDRDAVLQEHKFVVKWCDVQNKSGIH